ncbi:hypothetical protein MJN51_35710, partial [Salmonella enterica subsp. enterica serovar Kentucky]|nr:hypothetical protein [Salmonella enterica subsp. enterica serovar Kentucky]
APTRELAVQIHADAEPLAQATGLKLGLAYGGDGYDKQLKVLEVIIMGITLWIATQTIGLHTQLAANAGALKAGGQVASLDQGGS